MSQEVQTKHETTVKPSKGKVVRTDNLRVRRETKKRIQSELATLNKKDFGRKITADDYVALAITLIQSAHLEGLRERSLSNKDRLEQKYQEHCAKHGKVSKDKFLGVLLGGNGGNG